MSKKSAAPRIVRKSAANLAAPSQVDLDRLRAAMRGKIDTTDVSERRQFQRLKRDSEGRFPPRKSMIRDAVAREMAQDGLSAYRLWQLARVHYAGLSQSAVHEFLKGQRQLELPSIEALMAAVRLRVVRTRRPTRRPATRVNSGVR
jgi:hypothetical protein